MPRKRSAPCWTSWTRTWPATAGRGSWAPDYSALDAYVFTLCRWTRNFSAAPARERPHLGPYLQRVLARPAVQRVIANEKLAPPFV
jgi:glutathione S-transferase